MVELALLFSTAREPNAATTLMVIIARYMQLIRRYIFATHDAVMASCGGRQQEYHSF